MCALDGGRAQGGFSADSDAGSSVGQEVSLSVNLGVESNRDRKGDSDVPSQRISPF